ncbi:RTA1 like protein-domain-containing protein [Achaetomium macrosporum]|uniref:RTA1 like protein-domain-containing protein n=1 Tax=Achaetomium macrosporum TaxID=79813 RepID=A0AAN7C2W6_9PEZI|nr:RTA1 like protein-domain-containing protein [Achaetomium macrosporum]
MQCFNTTAMAANITLPANPTPDELSQCTLDTCPLTSSFYMYRISILPNAVFLGIFSAHFLGYLAIWVFRRRGMSFTIPMLLGVACEIVGYVGRIKSYFNQWEEDAFLIQVVCLTIGPAFLSAGIYLCLSRIVAVYGAQNSRIPAGWYTRIFIPCDIVSLLLQAGGGTAASIALSNRTSLDPGDNAMLAGLILQVVTLLIFIVLVADFGVRTWRRRRALGAQVALAQDPALVWVRNSRRFKGFLVALAVAVVTVFWRSYMFVWFEGVMIVLAVSALLIFHPAVCLGAVIESGAKSVRGRDEEMAKFAGSGGSSGETTDSGENSIIVPGRY